MATDSGTYRDLLHSAYVRGWDDGAFAAQFEPSEGIDPARAVCQGRTPTDFARSLWSPRRGQPPAGLELNAPLWYAFGLTEALALAGSPAGAPSARLPARS